MNLTILPAPLLLQAPLATGRDRRPGLLAAALRRASDAAIGFWSQIPNDPVLDIRLFPWTAGLRTDWQAIRDEAVALRPALAAAWRHGEWIEVDETRMPVTAAALAQVPGLRSAGVSFLAPGAHVSLHRGTTRALVTCQLGLSVPRDGDARMRIDGRVVRWAEGETLVFDDTAPHEIWNDTAAPRIVLVVRFARPLRQPARWLAERLSRAR